MDKSEESINERVLLEFKVKIENFIFCSVFEKSYPSEFREHNNGLYIKRNEILSALIHLLCMKLSAYL